MIREYIYFVDDNPNGTSGMTEEEIIRCKDCLHCWLNVTVAKSNDGEEIVENECSLFEICVDEYGFCSFAKRTTRLGR